MLDICKTDLDKYFCNFKNITDIRVKSKIICDIAIGMWYIHDHWAVHRDMKPANVLMDYSTGGKPPNKTLAFEKLPHCRVCDLGMMSQLTEEKPNWIADNLAGTNMFWAPESRYGCPYDAYKADYFQMGIVIFYVLEQRMPWGSNEEFKKHNKPGEGWEALKIVGKRCISRNQHDRLRLHEIYDTFAKNLPDVYKEAKKDICPTEAKYLASRQHFFDFEGKVEWRDKKNQKGGNYTKATLDRAVFVWPEFLETLNQPEK